MTALNTLDFFDVIFQKQHHGIDGFTLRAAGTGDKSFFLTGLIHFLISTAGKTASTLGLPPLSYYISNPNPTGMAL
jgi:hypothetical protein